MATQTTKVHLLQALPTVGQLHDHTRAFYWACLGPLSCLAVVQCRLALSTALGCACTCKAAAGQQQHAHKHAHHPVIFQITNSVPEHALLRNQTTAPNLECVVASTYVCGKVAADFASLNHRRACGIHRGEVKQVVSAAGASTWQHKQPRCIFCKPSPPLASCTIIHALSTGQVASKIMSCKAILESKHMHAHVARTPLTKADRGKKRSQCIRVVGEATAWLNGLEGEQQHAPKHAHRPVIFQITNSEPETRPGAGTNHGTKARMCRCAHVPTLEGSRRFWRAVPPGGMWYSTGGGKAGC